jgi:hypothetical protein
VGRLCVPILLCYLSIYCVSILRIIARNDLLCYRGAVHGGPGIADPSLSAVSSLPSLVLRGGPNSPLAGREFRVRWPFEWGYGDRVPAICYVLVGIDSHHPIEVQSSYRVRYFFRLGRVGRASGVRKGGRTQLLCQGPTRCHRATTTFPRSIVLALPVSIRPAFS